MSDSELKEKFFNEVKRVFSHQCAYLSEKEVDEYLSSSEAKEEIDNRFNRDIKKYRNNEMTEKVFVVGGGSSVGYCLSLMY